MSRKTASPKSRVTVGTVWLLGVMAAFCGQGASADAAAPVANAARAQPPMSSDTTRLLQDAERAQTAGDFGVALVQLKNAVRLAPRNGEDFARGPPAWHCWEVGIPVPRSEELRQARTDSAAEELVVPAILDTMVVRGEAEQLLAEFADPLPGSQSSVAADIFRARGLALQILGRSTEANDAMARSVSLRRDARSLTAQAKLAMQQGNFTLAQRMLDEAGKLAPTNEDVLNSQIALLYQSGEMKKGAGGRR